MNIYLITDKTVIIYNPEKDEEITFNLKVTRKGIYLKEIGHLFPNLSAIEKWAETINLKKE